MEDALSKRLIDEAISLGGSNLANRSFSTKDIATAAGVSEPTLFARFPSKDDLIAAASESCAAFFALYAASLREAGLKGEPFVAKILDYAIKNREKTVFLLNYAHCLPSSGFPETDGRSFRSLILKTAPSFLPSYASLSPDELFIAFTSYARTLVFAAAYILNGVWPDNEEVRDSTCRYLLDGANGYLKGDSL